MKVTIIGAGIAGPALAMFLRRAGYDVTLCEARDQAADGAFLTLAPNGMHVLAQLQLKQEIERVGEPTYGMTFQNARGEHVGIIDNRDSPDRYGACSITLKRGDLQRALLEGARREGVTIQLGKRLEAIHQNKSVRLEFADGSSLQSDLAIGCDGLRSRTRALILPDAPQPKFNGLLDYGGMVRARGDEPLEPGWNLMVFGNRAFFGALLGARGEIWWFHNGVTEEGEVRARLLSAHSDDPPFIRDILERTPEILGPWPQHDILGLPRWHQGRVCLIGDAAHATTPSAGQGASLALEDAALLARELREGRDFASFQALRERRVHRIVMASRRNGSNKAPGPVGAWFRDRMLPAFLKLSAKSQHEAISYQANFS